LYSTAEILPLPDIERSTVVASAPGDGFGYWAGSPSVALADDGTVFIAYRLRRPFGVGRGYANVLARSEDGEDFETVGVLVREDFDCDSLERPALVALPDGRWRLYVSCATPGTFHWRVDVLEADDPACFDPSQARTVLPGDEHTGVKDPVISVEDGTWHLWLCCHPLDVPDATDRMFTRYSTSDDGFDWVDRGVALRGSEGEWDQRGARVSDVVHHDGRWFAYYDGRAGAEENGEERTGIAVGDSPCVLTALPGPAVFTPTGSGSLRYVSSLELPDGGSRLYYETTRFDGGHDLRTEYVPNGRMAAAIVG
jgi:hypothetical protein